MARHLHPRKAKLARLSKPAREARQRFKDDPDSWHTVGLGAEVLLVSDVGLGPTGKASVFLHLAGRDLRVVVDWENGKTTAHDIRELQPVGRARESIWKKAKK